MCYLDKTFEKKWSILLELTVCTFIKLNNRVSPSHFKTYEGRVFIFVADFGLRLQHVHGCQSSSSWLSKALHVGRIRSAPCLAATTAVVAKEGDKTLITS